MSHATFAYVGQELDLFLEARNWKNYWVSVLRPYISGDVLEVGAGLGANSAKLNNRTVRSIHCLEPDEALADQLRRAARGRPEIVVSAGTVDSLSSRSFDSVLYINVLEHITDDKGELAKAARLLRTGGRLIVLAPAHQALLSPFDLAVGHHRRYDRHSLRSCSPASCRLEKMWYLDCIGLLASIANRLMLRQSLPTRRQIAFWDRYMIPASRVLDPCLGHSVGKSIAALWLRAG